MVALQVITEQMTKILEFSLCMKKNENSFTSLHFSRLAKDGSGNELEDTSAHNASAILGSSEDHALPTLEREDTVHHNTDRKKPGFNKVCTGYFLINYREEGGCDGACG